MSRVYNIPPLQSVTEVGATTDQATTYTGGLYSDASGGSNAFNFHRGNTVTGVGSGAIGYDNNLGAFDYSLAFGAGNTVAGKGGSVTAAALVVGSGNTTTSHEATGSIFLGTVLGQENVINAYQAQVFGYVNTLASGSVSAAEDVQVATVFGSINTIGKGCTQIVINGTQNSVSPNKSNVVIIGKSNNCAFNNCIVIGEGTLPTADNQCVIGGTTTLYRFNGTFADSETLKFGTGKDATISYDGANLILNPDAVGSGKVSINSAYTLPNTDGTATYILATDGAGTVSWTAPPSGGSPGGSDTQIQYNNAGAFGGTAAFTWDGTNLDLTSGDFRLDDNVDLVFGTGNDAKIYYDGTNMIIDPTVVGSGDLLVGPTANQDLRCNFLGLAGSAISANAVVNCSTSGSARGCLAFSYTKTGGTNIVANINSTVNYQLTTNANAVGVSSTVSEQVSNTGNSNYRCYSAAWNSTVNITTGTHIFKGIELDGGNGPTSASGATVIQVGVHVLPMASFTSATNTRIGGIFEHDLMVTDNTKVVFEGVGGTTYTVGDTYMVYSSSASELQTFVNGNELITLTSTALGFFAVAPQARPAAYTQTYSTATRTHNNVTSSSVATTAATNVAPFGYTTAAQADAIPVAINAVAADLLNLKQLVNQMLDDLQGYGLLQ